MQKFTTMVILTYPRPETCGLGGTGWMEQQKRLFPSPFPYVWDFHPTSGYQFYPISSHLKKKFYDQTATNLLCPYFQYLIIPLVRLLVNPRPTPTEHLPCGSTQTPTL